MNKLKFVCTLLSDVILNQNAGSKEQQSTLDFIPGNVFLGIVASRLYSSLSAEEAMRLFHSGEVRFGDAHPLCDGHRSLRIPAVLYYRKGEKLTEDGAYVMYRWKPDDSQPKQCRNGFYVFLKDNRCVEAKTNKSVAIKSAYDSEMRCSQDEQMYAYESLNKGMRFAFEIEIDDTVDGGLVEKMTAALVGKKHVGHSKTSQYGLVSIALENFDNVESQQVHEEDEAVVYADGRLIFIDESGMPTFRPTAQLLGFGKGAGIDWGKSQVRTFQYAPWNAKRHNPDTDRCGFEKGSVFVVNLNETASPTASQYVGCYNNEGFGKVVYNPEFLKSDDWGKSVLDFMDEEKAYSHIASIMNVNGSMNRILIKKVRAMAEDKTDVYSIVNGFVKNNRDKFNQGEERFASQWGYIRDLAETMTDLSAFKDALDDYLTHGVAAEKWKFKRLILDDFIQGKSDFLQEKWYPKHEKWQDFMSKNWREVMTNLAAEMAKQCKI